jgi:MFS transporter, ACS family, D-galactonate transporter
MSTTIDQSGLRPTNRRYFIMALLFVTVVINYLDRSNLSIAAPALAGALHIDAVGMGWVFSAFGWIYTTVQIPTGAMVDRVNPRKLYPLTMLLWSLATLSLGFAAGIVSLILLRMAVGLFEAPAYPMNNRIATTWFGERERAGCIGVYTSAQWVGLAFLAPVLSWILVTWGWQVVFIATGIVGIGWSIVWFLVYRDPALFPGMNQAEIDLIAEGGGIPDLSRRAAARSTRFAWRDLAIVLSRRKLWGIYLGQFGLGSTQIFFLTWFPTYLVKYKHMDFIKAGFVASIPFLAAFVGVLCSGLVSDWLVRRGASLGTARKTPIIVGLLLSTIMIGANFTDNETLVVVFLTLAFFANGLASITWSLISSTAPERLIGLTGGVFNFIGGLAGISVPIVIGYLVQDDSFAPALTMIVGLALMGALSYIFLVGKVERVPDLDVPEKEGAANAAWRRLD